MLQQFSPQLSYNICQNLPPTLIPGKNSCREEASAFIARKMDRGCDRVNTSSEMTRADFSVRLNLPVKSQLS